MDFELLNAVSYLEKPDGIIAMPFASRYVLFCRLEHNDALGRLYRLSCNQHDWQPLLLGYDYNALEPFITNPAPNVTKLMQQHWPGALVIRLGTGVHLKDQWFDPLRLGLMQPENRLIRDLLSLQPGGVLMAVDACRFDDPPAKTAKGVQDSFGDDVDYILRRDEQINPGIQETLILAELSGSIRILRSGQIVLD